MRRLDSRGPGYKTTSNSGGTSGTPVVSDPLFIDARQSGDDAVMGDTITAVLSGTVGSSGYVQFTISPPQHVEENAAVWVSRTTQNFDVTTQAISLDLPPGVSAVRAVSWSGAVRLEVVA